VIICWAILLRRGVSKCEAILWSDYHSWRGNKDMRVQQKEPLDALKYRMNFYSRCVLLVAALCAGVTLGATSSAVALESEVAWTVGWGGVGYDGGVIAQPLADGSIITISNVGSETLTQKFSTTGSLLWSHSLGNNSPRGAFTAESSTLLPDGRALFFGSVEQNPLDEPQKSDAKLIAVNTDGISTVISEFGGAGSEFIKSVGMCSDGSFFVGGTVWDGSVDPGNAATIGMVDLFIARFDSSFRRTWIKQFGSTNNDALFSVSCGPSNSAVISAWGAASINGQGSNDHYNFYVIKYDATGNLISTVESERDFGFWSPQSGVSAPDGSMYVVGEHNGQYLGSLPCTQAALGGSFISKYNISGELVWRQIIDCGNLNRRVAVDAWGNLYVLGGAGNIRVAGQEKFGGDDILLHKYTSDGERMWTRQFGSSDDEYGNSIAIDSEGNVIIGAIGKGLLDNYQPVNEFDALLMKNRVGETGVRAGPTENVLPPVYVPIEPLEMTFNAVSAGGFHSCGLLTNAEVWCWGRNTNGELGVGNTTQSPVPLRVENITNTIAISTGGSHTCAVSSGGAVKCWGSNAEGQLANAAILSSSTPIAVSGISEISMLSTGTAHTCALNNNGNVWCWGLNDHGQVGDGSNQSIVSTPTLVAGVSNVVAIASGGSHSCAQLATGGIKCWGANDWGQLGDSTTDEKWAPATVVGISNAVSVAVGILHSCATLNSGIVKCWGRNDYGQIGDGTTVDKLVPTVVGEIDNATQLALGRSSTCARQTAGSVKCWGRNSVNELGNGNNTSNLLRTAVSGLTNASKISSSYAHTCSVTSAGGVSCWGYNSNGQLGDGSYISLGIPVSVKIAQEIVAAVPNSLKTSDEAVTVPSRSTGGLLLSYTSHTPSVCIVESYQLLPLSIGTCRITIRQPGNEAFSAAIALNKTLQIVGSSSTPSISNAPIATEPIANAVAATPVLSPSAVRTVITPRISTSRSASARSIAVFAKLKLLPASKVSLKVVRSSVRNCRVSGAVVRGLKSGSCRVTVTVVPKKGRATSKTVTLKVTK